MKVLAKDRWALRKLEKSVRSMQSWDEEEEDGTVFKKKESSKAKEERSPLKRGLGLCMDKR